MPRRLGNDHAYRMHMEKETGGRKANRRRVRNATKVFNYYVKTVNRTPREPFRDNLIDLMTDLMHLAQKKKIDVTRLLGTSEGHFRVERPFGY